MKNVEIIGTGSYVPDRIVTNDELSKIVETSDEWISSRSGIKERRISLKENTSELAAKAGLRAIENAKLEAKDIDLVIVATTSPDAFTPSTACLVQAIIGAENAVCFDVSAACTGFIFALNTATQFIKTGEYKTALVIGSEVLSKIMNWEDRTTCVLFGDGAGAVVLREGSNGIIKAYMGSDGVNSKFLYCPAVEVGNPFAAEIAKIESKISMNGREVFKFAVKAMDNSIKNVLEASKIDIDDIDYIVPHQANIRIIEFVAKKLEISMDKFFVNLHNYGNTSGATIPLALDEMNKKGMLKKGNKIILVGFGGGLTWGAAIIEWTM
ncbi:beta-ketoacyl-ACP synthase III [Clostridium hydrogenum]|uniref:beta-ketoacyl-ACP synthase III n=1 Tax=Clostridium hydrogenum TaxID=2855764 RepID=UPI002E341774|nr:beta-ketoacyl-ACP synthase 3 [Clostridium hydrogenum]